MPEAGKVLPENDRHPPAGRDAGDPRTLLNELATRLSVSTLPHRPAAELFDGVMRALDKKQIDAPNEAAFKQAVASLRDGFDSWARDYQLLDGSNRLSVEANQSSTLARGAIAGMIREVLDGVRSVAAIEPTGRWAQLWSKAVELGGRIGRFVTDATAFTISPTVAVVKFVAAVPVAVAVAASKLLRGLNERSEAKVAVAADTLSSDVNEPLEHRNRPPFARIIPRDPGIWSKLFVTETKVVADGSGTLAPLAQRLGHEHCWIRSVPAIHTDDSRASAPVTVHCKVKDLPRTADGRLRIPIPSGMGLSALAIESVLDSDLDVRENIAGDVELDQFIALRSAA